jgi:hypothetical protein
VPDLGKPPIGFWSDPGVRPLSDTCLLPSGACVAVAVEGDNAIARLQGLVLPGSSEPQPAYRTRLGYGFHVSEPPVCPFAGA